MFSVEYSVNPVLVQRPVHAHCKVKSALPSSAFSLPFPAIVPVLFDLPFPMFCNTFLGLSSDVI